MWYKNKILSMTLLTIGIIVGTQSSALAECDQSKVTGTWNANTYFFASDGLNHWLYCRLKVDNNGNINPSTSVCNYDFGGESLFPRSRFRIYKNCTMQPVDLDFFDSNGVYQFTSRINAASTNRGQNVIQGAGDGGTNFPFTLTATKR